jgi:hypothetical protein
MFGNPDHVSVASQVDEKGGVCSCHVGPFDDFGFVDKLFEIGYGWTVYSSGTFSTETVGLCIFIFCHRDIVVVRIVDLSLSRGVSIHLIVPFIFD